MSVAPGWYVDPADPATQRYWDGETWLGDALPAGAATPDGPVVNPVRPARVAATAAPPVPVYFPPGYYPPPPGPPPPGYYTDPGPVLPPPPGHYDPAAPAPPGTYDPAVPAPTSAPSGATDASGATSVPPYQYPPPFQYPPGYPLPPGYPYPYVYQPVSAAPRPHGLTIAAPGARLLARLIDIGILLVLTLAVNGVLLYQLGQLVYEQVQAGPTADTALGERGGGLEIAICLITAALWAAYEIPQLANGGQTIGKRVMGIKVMRLESDLPLGFGRALRRWWGLGWGTLLWPCFGIGFLLQFIDCLFVVINQPLNQALHDRSAATVVVHVGRRGKKEQPDNTKTDPAGTKPRT